MKDVICAKKCLEIDNLLMSDFHIPGILLMEQAANAVCKAIISEHPCPCTVLCIVGKGNNGGDALATARILQTNGYSVKIGLLSNTLPSDADLNLRYFLGRKEVYLLNEDSLADFFSYEAEVIVDGLLGIGLNRPVIGFYAEIIRCINRHTAKVYAIDIPSGVNADNGHAETAVYADKTITFTALKPGHLLYPGKEYCGKVELVQIAPPDAVSALLSANIHWVDNVSLPKRKPNTHKTNYGRLAVLAGSKGMAGAAVMCSKAALAGGSGLTTFLGCEYVTDILQASVPAVMAKSISDHPNYLCCDNIQVLLDEYQAFVLGPGIAQNKNSIPMVLEAAVTDIPKVIDADALNILSREAIIYGDNTVITPHPAEFSRLSGLPIKEILGYPIESAQHYAKMHKITVLLKGATSVVTDGDDVYLITAGTPGMAKGGSGDVLSGVIGALLAQGFSPIESAYSAAYFCGKAAESAAIKHGEYSMLPEDTIVELGHVM